MRRTVQGQMQIIQAWRKLQAVARQLAGVIRRLPQYERAAVLYLKHEWKVRWLSRRLAKALGESWEASSWPGDRLAVGVEMSEKVEKLTRLLKRETEGHGRHVALLQ
jgi:hypothetical protein